MSSTDTVPLGAIEDPSVSYQLNPAMSPRMAFGYEPLSMLYSHFNRQYA
jgi:hypothetical protein